jgi:Tfp pilus assembly pilus retraction ATPase PilT
VHQIPSVIQTSEQAGMQTMDHALKTLVLADKIDMEEAVLLSTNPEDFRRLVSLK